MLEYVYCDSMNLDEDVALELLVTLDKYSISKLQARCENFLCGSLTVDNVVKIAKVTESVNNGVLKAAIVQLLRRDVKLLSEKKNILEIPKSILLACLFKNK